jgi:hypothetical protein
MKADSVDDMYVDGGLHSHSVFLSVFVYLAIMKHNSDCLLFMEYANNGVFFPRSNQLIVDECNSSRLIFKVLSFTFFVSTFWYCG